MGQCSGDYCCLIGWANPPGQRTRVWPDDPIYDNVLLWKCKSLDRVKPKLLDRVKPKVRTWVRVYMHPGVLVILLPTCKSPDRVKPKVSTHVGVYMQPDVPGL
jgi:hypothetical protein